VTVIELVYILFVLCVVIFLAVVGYHHGGWLVAYVFGISGWFVTIIVLHWLRKFCDWLRGNPPNCKCGLPASVRTYETDANQNFVSICTCGKRYARDGKKFMEVLPDGSLHPYLKREKARWVDDDASEKAVSH